MARPISTVRTPLKWSQYPQKADVDTRTASTAKPRTEDPIGGKSDIVDPSILINGHVLAYFSTTAEGLKGGCGLIALNRRGLVSDGLVTSVGLDATTVGLNATMVTLDAMTVGLRLGLCIPVKSNRYPNLPPTPCPSQP